MGGGEQLTSMVQESVGSEGEAGGNGGPPGIADCSGKIGLSQMTQPA